MKTLHYLKRAFTLPPHIVIQKIGKKLKNFVKSKKNAWRDAAFTTYEIRYQSPISINTYLSRIDLNLLDRALILQLCDRYINHEFDLLGSGWVQVFHGMNCKGIGGCKFPPSTKVQMKGPNLPLANEILACLSQGYIPIDWHIDFKSGFRWNENVSSLDIQYGDRQGADVKVPWELARMQHLTMLAFGYALTSDKKYCFEFQNQVLDFIGSNPPRYGVNWVCTMDVGIRIANWLFAYDLFKAYNASFEKDFEEIFFRSVYEHGKHIRSHLEWDPYLRSNHYLANIAGLLFAAAYLPQKEWLEFSVRELEAEVLSQFHPDGTNFEASTSYHRLSAEMAVYSAGLALQLGVEFSREFIDRIQKMADFTRDITKPDGTIVQFGDNDSGRFIKLLPDVSELDHRYLIRAIRGMKNLNSVVASQFTQVQETPQQVSAYIDFGLYMQRNGPWFFAFRCGNIGQKGNGGHAHNDQLSFELAVNGVSMIIDPGTYVYTPLPDERRRFRSTAMHNTVAVVGMEQNEDKGLFQMKDRSQGKMICFEEGLFIGQHEGLGKPVKRTIKIFHDRIEGLDAYEGMKEIYFHFASGWVVELVSENRALLSFGNLHAQFLSESGRCRLVQSTVSSGYGKIERAQVVVLEAGCEPASWMIFL